jgi:hypothetical protein
VGQTMGVLLCRILYVRRATGVRLSLGDTPSYLTSENIPSIRIVDASNNSCKQARKPCDGPSSAQCHVVSLLPASAPVTLLTTCVRRVERTRGLNRVIGEEEKLDGGTTGSTRPSKLICGNPKSMHRCRRHMRL